MIKRIIKILSFIIVIILLGMTTTVLLLKAGYFNSSIADKISYYASRNINADIKVESITGDVLSNFQVNDILFTLYDDTLLYCEQIEVQHNVKYLLKKQIHLNKLFFSEILIHAVQSADSVWNFSEIKSRNPTKNSTSSEFNWSIFLNDVQLQNVLVHAEQFEKSSYIPAYLESSIKLNAFYSEDNLNIVLDSLVLFTESPELEVFQIMGDFNFSDGNFNWNNFFAELNTTHIQSQGQINLESSTISPSWIKIEPLSLEDIQSFFPQIEIYGAPNIQLEASGNEKRYDFSFTLKQDQQNIALDAWLVNVKQNPEYEFTLNVQEFDGEYWMHDEQFKSSIVGTLIAKGKGFDPKSNSFDLKGNFGDIKYGDYNLKDFVIKASKQEDQFSGNINSKTWMGILNLKFGLNKIFGDPQYEFYCEYQNINLKGLPSIDSISTNLNGNVYLS